MNTKTARDIEELISFFRARELQFQGYLKQALSDGNIAELHRQARLMKGIAKEAQQRKDDMTEVVVRNLTAQFEKAVGEAQRQLEKLGVELEDCPLFDGYDIRTVRESKALVDGLTLQWHDHHRKAIKKIVMQIRQKATENGWSSGKAFRALRDEVMAKHPDFTFVDRAGRKWAPEKYLRMVSRTLMAESQREAHEAAYTEAGVDLVKVSIHGTTCPKCNPWEGKVLSLTGATEGYPTVAEARAKGLFHANCKHRLLAHVA